MTRWWRWRRLSRAPCSTGCCFCCCQRCPSTSRQYRTAAQAPQGQATATPRTPARLKQRTCAAGFASCILVNVLGSRLFLAGAIEVVYYRQESRGPHGFRTRTGRSTASLAAYFHTCFEQASLKLICIYAKAAMRCTLAWQVQHMGMPRRCAQVPLLQSYEELLVSSASSSFMEDM